MKVKNVQDSTPRDDVRSIYMVLRISSFDIIHSDGDIQLVDVIEEQILAAVVDAWKLIHAS